jgi:L-threonylcarbamoyladenylate synthase
VLIGASSQISLLSPGVPRYAQCLAAHFWPGALTLILPALQTLPMNLSPSPTIGVRLPDHAFVQQLIQICGPLATTSANLSGAPNSLTAQEVSEQLGNRIDLILDGGKTPGEIPSTVVDCSGEKPRVIREGAVTREALNQILDKDHRV